MTAAQWKSQMRKWGVNATYLPGFETRGRNHLPFAPIGVMIHHTGSGNQDNGYINWLFLTGRPAEGIPGPLAQMMTMSNGRSIIGARGRSNHAGKGMAHVRDKVARDAASLTSEIRPRGTGTVDGNSLFYGDEVAFSGSDPMDPEQYAEVVLKTAAICDFHDWGGGSVIGHGEWTSNKWDPGQTDMSKFRRDVNARLKAGPSGTTNQEDEMSERAERRIDALYDTLMPASKEYGRAEDGTVARWDRESTLALRALLRTFSPDGRLSNAIEAAADTSGSTTDIDAIANAIRDQFGDCDLDLELRAVLDRVGESPLG